jgi:C-terminal processing protease CtpA/Prc
MKNTMRAHARQARLRALSALFAAALAACGGGGGGGADAGGPPLPASSDDYAQRCAPTNPLASASLRNGSLEVEKKWLRSYMDEAYLWYEQIPSVNAALPSYSDSTDVPASMGRYFYALRTPQLTPTGKPVDQFSFAMPTADWVALSQQGTEVGYGVIWAVSSPPNAAVVAWVAPGSAADRAGVQRGDQLVSIDGALVGSLAPAAFYDAVYPAAADVHRLTFRRAGGTSGPDAVLAAGPVTLPSVPLAQTFPTASGTVGYMLFNSHDAPSEAALIAAVNQLKDAGTTDLVLDLRYNTGGYLYIASQLAYMIAGPARTAGRTFQKLGYNAKRTDDNARPATPFLDTSCIPNAEFTACTQDAPLPTLGLGRVYVLATDSTCSASESIINGLRGIDVDVRIVGSTTCGKPYGFRAKDNCGISYFPIEFKGTNAKGFGDYADGFTPDCAAGDDLAHALGSPDEGLLATALAYRQSGVCVAQSDAGIKRPLVAAGRSSARIGHGPRGLSIVGPAPR